MFNSLTVINLERILSFHLVFNSYILTFLKAYFVSNVYGNYVFIIFEKMTQDDINPGNHSLEKNKKLET